MWSRDNNGIRREGVEGEPTATNDEDVAAFSVENGADGQVLACIARGMEFKGCLQFSGTVRIDGRLEGEINTDGTVLVGRDAVIFAQVRARKVLCLGQITGDVQATEKIKLLAPAVLNGSATAPVVAMEEGVLFSGTLEMRQSESGAAAKALPREQPAKVAQIPQVPRAVAMSAS